MDVAKRFGENLRAVRREAGLSHEEVGIRASLHRTEVGLLERGERTPRIDTALKLAGAVEVGLERLTEGISWRPGRLRPGGFALSGEPEEGGKADA